MKTAYMLVSPDMAKEWLSQNIDNRRVRPARVAQYARDMVNGKWENDSPNPIVFGENGILKDGQHRLMALIKADVSLNFLVCWVDDGVKNIDTGATRSVGDYIKMNGGDYLQNSLIAGITLKITKDIHQAPTRAEIEEEYLKDSATWDKAEQLSRMGSSHGIGRKSYMILAIRNALVCGVSEATLVRFCNVINTGLSDGRYENSAILARNTLIDMKGRTASRTTQWNLCGLLEEYIRLFVLKSERTRKLKEPGWCYSLQLKEKQTDGTR